MSTASDAVFNGKSNAFPSTDSRGEGPPGMTLREYFAGQALISVSCGIIAEANHGTSAGSLAAAAVEIADALLVELAKPSKQLPPG